MENNAEKNKIKKNKIKKKKKKTQVMLGCGELYFGPPFPFLPKPAIPPLNCILKHCFWGLLPCFAGHVCERATGTVTGRQRSISPISFDGVRGDRVCLVVFGMIVRVEGPSVYVSTPTDPRGNGGQLVGMVR